eukprot:3307059-Amphidinium_carterae.1
MWDNALRPGRGRGPTGNLKQLAERLGWLPAAGLAMDSGFHGMKPPSVLSGTLLRQLKLDGQSQKEDRKAALNAALGGVWHEERAHSAFEHIVLHCPHWNKERREACLPTHTA